MAEDLEKELRRSAESWRKWYDWLQWYFPDEEAHEYAEKLTQVTEGKKRATERSPHEIKRETKLLSNTEALIMQRTAALTAFFELETAIRGLRPKIGLTR